MFLLKGSVVQRLLLSFLLLVPAGCSEPQIRNLDNNVLKSSSLTFSSDESSILQFIGSLIGMSMGEITTFLSLAKVGLGVVGTLESIFSKVFNGTTIDFNIFDHPGLDRQLLSIFEIITLRLEQIQDGITGTQSGLRALVRYLPNMVRWEIALDTLESYVQPINNLYHKFSFYQQHKMSVENLTLLDFATAVISHDTTSIQSMMANIHSMVSPSDPPIITGSRSFGREEYEVNNRVTSQMSSKLRRILAVRGLGLSRRLAKIKMQEISLRPSIFNMLEEAIDNYGICNQKQTPQQLIFGLYTMVAVAQARGYTMGVFGYDLLTYHDKGTFSVERQLAQDLYMHYSTALFTLGIQALEQASRAYRKCDAVEHIENETFVQITELLQGYIENEVDLNDRGTCGHKCSSYQHSKVTGCYLPSKQYCGKHRRCKGLVHSCKFFDSDADICLGSKPYRRYDWIKYENAVVLGKQTGQCKNTMKVDSWWRFLYHCSYCVCLCDDPKSPTSDRFISLRPAVSDIAENKVVTGLRFVKKDRVLQIEIMEGFAFAQGQIKTETLRWVEAQPISVESGEFKEDEDYFTLKYEARNLDLDRLKAPKSHVVTGVRFRMLGQHVNLEMWVTPINFTTGKLNPQKSFWTSNDNTPLMMKNPRREISLYQPDVPTRNRLENDEISRPETFIKFQPTNLHYDMAQLTVPYFDAQPVTTSPATWLEGVEIYHRGRRGFGGFIAVQIFNYDLSRHLHDEKLEHENFL